MLLDIKYDMKTFLRGGKRFKLIPPLVKPSLRLSPRPSQRRSRVLSPVETGLLIVRRLINNDLAKFLPVPTHLVDTKLKYSP